MRIATVADSAEDEAQKEKLSALASNLVATLEAVVETTEEQLDERAKEVENVVKAAAEPDSGEFLVPLSAERTTAMRKALESLDESALDEGFLSTVDAWMNKSHLDGMVSELVEKTVKKNGIYIDPNLLCLSFLFKGFNGANLTDTSSNVCWDTNF